MAIKFPKGWALVATIGLLTVFSAIFIDFLFGWLVNTATDVGEDSPFRRILKSPIYLASFLLFFRLKPREMMILTSIFLGLVAATLVRLFYSPSIFGGFDFKYLVKGPLLVLATFTMVYASPLNTACLLLWVKRASWIWLIFIVLAIFSHVSWGYGLMTYERFGGFKSFFPSQNVLTLVIAVVWSIIFFSSRSLLRILSLFVCLLCFAFIGTKSGFLFVTVALLIYAYISIRALSICLSRSLLLFGLVAFLFIFYYPHIFLDILMKYSFGSDRLAYFLDEYGVISGIFSYRDKLSALALGLLWDESPVKWIFGLGYENFSTTLGSFLNRNRAFVEIDFVDALAGGGLIGLLSYLGPALAIGAMLWKNMLRTGMQTGAPYCIGIAIYLVASATSGHAAFSGTASIVHGVLLGMGWRLINYDRRNTDFSQCRPRAECPAHRSAPG